MIPPIGVHVSPQIHPDGNGFLLTSSMRVPRPIDEVFEFFSDARNLERITPPSLSFRVLNEGPIEMEKGTLIDYRLRVHRLPLRWQSEIRAWEPPNRFVDEQRKGPYRYWIHEHLFEDQGDSTVVRDQIQYGVLGGRLVNRLFVSRDVKSIFSYRSRSLAEIFGSLPATSATYCNE